MNIRALQLFHQVVATGSLLAASEAMSLSASAASRMVSLLEAETKLRLFSRARRRLTLTKEGEAFYREVEHILAGLKEIPRIAAEIRSRSSGQLRLVTGPRQAHGLVAPAIGSFRRKHPAIRVSVDIDWRFDIQAGVGTRLYDLGIVTLPLTHPQVEITNRPLFSVRIEALLPASHDLARKPAITARDLESEPLLGLWPGQRWREQIDDFFIAGGVRPKYCVETRSSLMACQMVREGAGIAMLDRLCAAPIDLRGTVMRPLEPERWISFGYVHQTRQPPGDNALAFIDCVREVLERFRSDDDENAKSVILTATRG